MVGQFKIERICNFLLALLDQVVAEFFDPPAFDANEMVMMQAAFQLKH